MSDKIAIAILDGGTGMALKELGHSKLDVLDMSKFNFNNQIFIVTYLSLLIHLLVPFN